jgi:hypothetical protein
MPRGAVALGAAVAIGVLIAGCTGAGGASPSSPVLSSSPTVTSTVGTSTSTRTVTTTLGTLTVPASNLTTVTVTTSNSATTQGPPPTTSEPKPVPGSCPYVSDADVMADNGQHTGQTSIIKTKPYPVCIFTRSDGGYLATTRIVVAKTAEQAAAAVNQHVPVDQSNPAIYPQGWKGGAMGNLNGVPGYPKAQSIYAVSKGTIAIIAISNQPQSIKGRQMVEQIVANLHL